jgi:hypothetical protein
VSPPRSFNVSPAANGGNPYYTPAPSMSGGMGYSSYSTASGAIPNSPYGAPPMNNPMQGMNPQLLALLQQLLGNTAPQ